MLDKKSLTELRSIGQGYGISDWSLDAKALIQQIEMRQRDMAPKPEIRIASPVYDARLMTKTPSRKSSASEIIELLKPYTDAGLKLTLTDENWHMRFDRREDNGTIRMPLRVVLGCARRLMNAKS